MFRFIKKMFIHLLTIFTMSFFGLCSYEREWEGGGGGEGEAQSDLQNLK